MLRSKTFTMIKIFLSTAIAVVSAESSEKVKSEETKDKSDDSETEDTSVM